MSDTKSNSTDSGRKLGFKNKRKVVPLVKMLNIKSKNKEKIIQNQEELDFEVKLELNSQQFGAGDYVEGIITLNVKKHLFNTSGTLYIKFKAKEQIEYYENYDPESPNDEGLHKARVVYFNHQFNMINFEDEIQKQELKMNFKFRLDSYHPVSYEQIGEDFRILVQSKVIGEFRVSKKQKYKVNKIIQVNNSAYQASLILLNKLDKIFSFPETSCFCFRQGFLNVGVHLERNIFMPGEKMKCILDFENVCVKIKGIEVNIQNRGQVVDLYENVFNFRSNSLYQNIFQEQIKKGEKTSLELEIPIPEQCKNSINLKLIQINYELKITILTDHFFPLSFSKPEFSLGFWVYESDFLSEKKKWIQAMNEENQLNQALNLEEDPAQEQQKDFLIQPKNNSQNNTIINTNKNNSPNKNKDQVVNIVWNRSLFYPNKDRKWGIFSIPFWNFGKNKQMILKDSSHAVFNSSRYANQTENQEFVKNKEK